MRKQIILFSGLVALLAAGWWAYFPGLGGTFLFDDFNNLDKLGTYGSVHDIRSLALYLTSGKADPTGRPLSLLSFLIDANDWPADPAPFKRTNILLHLFNSLLLAIVLLKLGLRIQLKPPRAEIAAVIGAGLWALHPFFVSTTLYVVQREAMLPATFTLLGMLLWLHGRECLFRGQRSGPVLLLAGAWGCAALALLCKANGILLPLLLLTMESTVLPNDRSHAVDDTKQTSRFRFLRRWLLVGPSGILFAWLLTRVPGVLSGETYSRPWSIGQRLLTEPRVLCDYLEQLWIPRASNASLFNDGYHASTGLFHPWSTLPALGLIAGLIILGVHLRHKYPALAFAILFYFAGQLLESTLIPLELYFEHRNYLPAMPLFWPLAIWLTGEGPLRKLRYALAFLLPAMLAVLCHARAGIWGQPFKQAVLLAQVEPDSPRAQANAASYEIAHGAPDLAARRLEAIAARMPNEVQLTLNWINSECAQGAVSAKALDAALYSLKHNLANAEFVDNWLSAEIETVAQKRCRGLDLQTLEAMTKAVLENHNYGSGPARIAQIRQLEGRLDLAHGDGDAALRKFDEGLTAHTTPDRALLQAALLGEAGFPDLGLKHLAYYRTLQPTDLHLQGMTAVHWKLLEYEGYWRSEITSMESQLKADAGAVAPISSQHDRMQSATPAR